MNHMVVKTNTASDDTIRNTVMYSVRAGAEAKAQLEYKLNQYQRANC
jgi:hypothetical protein